MSNKLDGSQSPKIGANVLDGINGIFSAKPMAKYLSGARCTLKMNGKIIGFAFAISWNIKTEAVEIETIDDYMPYELAPQRISVSGAISSFRVPGSGPTQQLIQTDLINFLHQRYVEIEVRDSQTDNLIFLTKRALITSRQENIRSDSLADMTLTFKAVGWVDERSPELANGVGDKVDVNGTNPLTNIKKKLKDLF